MMMTPEKILTILEEESRFLIASHRRPDGDALGAALGLAAWLRGRDSTACVLSPDGVPEPYRSLPGSDGVETALSAGASDSIAIVLDTPDLDRAGAPDGCLRCAKLLINIDHHPDNSMFGDLNLVDPGASSTALLVYELIAASTPPPSVDVASLLYVGVLTDTGAFRFGNTDGRTFDTAAALVRLGADPAALARGVYGEQPVESLRLLGLVLASVERALEGRVSLMYVTRSMRDEAGATGDDIDGLASYGRLIEGVQVALLLREEGSNVRVSLRSSGRVDVNEIAKRLGGGGHGAAAGVVLDGPLDHARAALLATVEESLV
jgi:phosphoesterase RecJ-like protein